MILSIDHGTSGIKVALFSVTGELLGFDYEPTRTIFTEEGGVEADPDDWWEAFLKSSSRLVSSNASAASQISAITVSSTFSTTVAVDRNGRHIMNAITWMDARGATFVKEIMYGFPSIQGGYGLLKSLAWINKTGGAPSLTGKDDIAHVLYIKHRHPEIYEKTYKFLGSKDYLNLRLSGEFAATYDSIQLFWVTDIRDINNIKYDSSLIQRFGIDREKLPELLKSTDILGNLRTEIANQLGLRHDVKIVAGSPDHQSAQIGSGAIKDYDGHLYAGTSSWIECIVSFKKTDLFHFIASLPTAIPGKYQLTNEQETAGECLQFIMHNILFNRNALQNTQTPENYYQHIENIVRSVTPGSSGLIFTPWLNGERAPVDNNTIRGSFYNITLQTRSEHMLRSVFEGVALNARWNLTYVEQFIKKRMDPINFVGGGAKSDSWCQIYADIFNRTIRRLKNPVQANARGAAFIGSVGLNYIKFDDIPEIIQYDRVFYPDPKNRNLYDELFVIFRDIYKKNRTIFKRLNRSSSSSITV